MTLPPPAPLAQLRQVDEATWRLVYQNSGVSAPGRHSVTQALAAAFLGDAALARDLLAAGPYVETRPDWPDLTTRADEFRKAWSAAVATQDGGDNEDEIYALYDAVHAAAQMLDIKLMEESA